MNGPLELFLGDEVRLRKPHPCGSHDWTVVRLGADIGLRCHGCEHRVLLPRRTLEKRLKSFLRRGPGGPDGVGGDGDLGGGAEAEIAGIYADTEPIQ
ncbi:MAG: DUF951 domain-containing protein [Chloroflexia bacterium]|nr:DUF951 domain-containing protein [Chloroflexia bacterium]